MKNTVTSLAATVAILVVTTLGGIISARLLLPQGKGELTAVMLWPSLVASLGSLGVADAVTFFAARSGADLKRLFASGAVLALALSAALIAAAFIIVPLALSNQGPSVIQASLVYIFYIPLSLLTGVLMGMMLGRMQIGRYNSLRTFVNVGNVVGMVVLYLIGQVSVFTFTVAYLISSSLTLLLAVLCVSRDNWLGRRPSVVIGGQLLHYGVRAHVGSIASLFNLRLDQMLLSTILSASVLGLYVVAVSVGSLATLPALAVSLVVFPKVAGVAASARKAVLGRYTRLAFALSVVSAALIFTGATWLTRLFFGASYEASGDVARVLALASLPLASNVLLSAGLKANNLPQISSQGELLGLVITVIALLALVPAYQGMGAAWASVAAYSCTFLYLTWQTRQKIGVSMRQLFVPCVEDWLYLKNFTRCALHKTNLALRPLRG